MNESPASALSQTEKSLLGIFITLKLALLLLLPLTGDEAYFISWGMDVSSGYYDHPPVIGWLIYLLSFISEHYYFYRLAAFVVILLVSFLLYKMVLPIKGRQVALLVSLIFLTSPLSLIAIVFVNDLALLLFGLLGFYCFSRSIEKNDYALAFFGGVFLGLAFLSKYLAAPLFIGIFVYLIINRRAVNWRLVLLGAFAASLFVLQNLYFNIQNCWNNIVFNLFSRTEGGGFNLGYMALFLASLALVLPPQGLAKLPKVRIDSVPERIKQAIYVALCFFVIFLLVSSFKRIGLHWLYLLATFSYFLFMLLPETSLRGLLKYNALLSIAVAIGLLILITQVEALFGSEQKYRDVLIYTETANICNALPRDKTVFTLSYSKNSVLAYHCQNNDFHVISNTSKYGREDDKKVNFSQLADQDLLILVTERDDIEKVRGYFAAISFQAIKMDDNVDYFLVKAERFDFQRYRDQVLRKISNRFYKPPQWLPASSCEFNQKYDL